jgi:enoyl-CoA hydratase
MGCFASVAGATYPRRVLSTSSSSGDLQITYSHSNTVATLTIDNQKKLNTLNSGLVSKLIAATNELSRDDRLRCLVVTGAGEKAFIGGADIKEMAELNSVGARRMITNLHTSLLGLRRLPVPVVARIDGFALGAGMELAAACDVRYATRKSVFGMPETIVGIPSVIEAALLPGLVGWGKTRWMLLTGKNIDAETADRWGFLEGLVDDKDQLDAEADKFVEAILEAAPLAVRNQKRLIGKWESNLKMHSSIEAGIDAFEEAFKTDEPREYMKKVFLDARAKAKAEK